MKKVLLILLSVLLAMPYFLLISSGESETLPLYEEEAIFLRNEKNVKRIKKSASSAEALPSRYDARDDGIVPAVRNQGYSNSCWAFGSLSALEIDANKKGITSASSSDFSEAHLVWFTFSPDKDEQSPLYNESYVSSSPYTEYANWNRAAGTFARRSGAALESELPFSAETNDFSSMMNPDEALRYSTSSGAVLKNTAVFSSADEVKSWIMEHGSCTMAIFWNAAYENPETHAYNYTGGGLNHMVTVVGWDDNYSADNFLSVPSSDGAWIVRDSRGAAAHDNGYMMVSYKDSGASNFVGFEAQKAGEYDNIHTYNAIGYSSCITSSADTLTANIFSCEKDETLKALSFYTVYPQVSGSTKYYATDVGIEIYKNPDDSGNPASGEKVYSDTVSYQTAGFHTYALTSAVELNAGESYSVVLKYSSPDGSTAVPVETANSSTAFTCKPGQSFIFNSEKTDGWQDITDFRLGNFFINTYTDSREAQPEPVVTPSINIKNFLSSRKEDYKATVVFTAEVTGRPDGSTVAWYLDGSRVFEGDTYRVINAEKDYTVSVKLFSSDNKLLAESGEETVKISSGFFAKIIAFFRNLFGKLPVIYQ